MKILYHHRTRGDGAEGVHIREMINAFRELGHQVSSAAPRGVGGNAGLSASRGSQNSSRIKLFFKQTAEILYNLVVYIRLRTATRRARPDLIYERYSPFNFAGVLAAKHLQIPILVEVNATYAGKFGCRFAVFYPRILKWSESYVLRNADGIVVVSEALRDCVLRVRKSHSSVIVTPNAINSSQIKEIDHISLRSQTRRRLELCPRVVVGFVGSLRKWHGIDFLGDALGSIVAQVPEIHFLIVGTGEYEATIKQRVKEDGLDAYVTFVGPVPHDQVYRYIAAMDIGLMPDSNEFGSPMKILEYMVMGCVAVAPDLGPIREIIADGETGRVFEQRNLTEFVLALVGLCREQELRNSIGRNGREYVLRERTWTRNATHVLQLFDQIRLRGGV